MKNPRIYSLSTVGVIKHYVHDYLIHAERTDFVGSNGVGKSIIADLLQILFVYDTGLIRFGTDGVNKKDRNIHTLPYKQPHAYFFANVEIEENVFVLIGVMIPARTGARLTPFMVIKSSDSDREAGEIGMARSELLLARDFISNGSIPDLKTLAELFFEKGLYLKFYRNREDVKEYYHFLNAKRITPINLSNEDNLKAFAKVIQSFSKAKSLDLDNSNSIKQFLFDDSDKDFVSDYEQNKAALEKLLRQYEYHALFIKQLEKKRERLLHLRKLEQDSTEAFKAYRKSEVACLANNYLQTVAERKTIDEQHESYVNQLKTVEIKKARVVPLLGRMTLLSSQAEANDKLIGEYRHLVKERKDLEECISKLSLWKDIKLPVQTVSSLDFHDINIVDTDQVVDIASFAYPFIKRYGEWHHIVEKFNAQKARLAFLTNELNSAITVNQKWIDLLEKSDGASLLNWVLRNSTKLSPSQQAIVMKYFDLEIEKPSDPALKGRYVKVPDILQQDTHLEDADGFWLELGPMFEFIATDPLDNNQWSAENGGDLEKFTTAKKSSIQILKQQLKELDNVQKGNLYDKAILQEEFDLNLIEYSNLKKINEGLAYIVDVEEKLNVIEQLVVTKTRQIEMISVKLTGKKVIPEETDLEEFYAKKKKAWLGWTMNISRWQGAYTVKAEELQRNITSLKILLPEKEKRAEELERNFKDLNDNYASVFGQSFEITDFSEEEIMVTPDKESYDRAKNDYGRKYIEAASAFDDTKEGNHVAVNLELESENFSFEVLERALLGTQIRHTDDIGPALQQANLTLLSIADNVRDAMGKIFKFTISTYYRYEQIVKSINTFFKKRKISNRFVFNVDFKPNEILNISYLENLGTAITNAYKSNEIPFGHPVSEFVESYVRKAAKLPTTIKVNDLLNPKTYFDLSVKLTNEKQGRTSGSTGETYSAIALLGVARLSLVQTDQDGLKFIILEETGSLDNINFSTFPAVAKEFGYQIITMAPRPFGVTLSEEWYLHYLIKGKVDEDINHYPTASFFYTNDQKMDLGNYLEKQHINELD
jgi:hypothetical protein